MTKIAELIGSRDIDRFSKRVGLANARLRELVAGAEPTLGELRRVAEALNVSMDELVPPPAGNRAAQFLFRNADTAKHGLVSDRLSRKIGYSLDILKKSVQTDWLNAFTVSEQSFQEAELAATRFRDLFYGGDQVSPLFDLPNVLANSLSVVLFTIKSSEIDGASAYFRGVPFIFVSSRFEPRMLFTTGHELGHLIAHRDHDFAVIDDVTDDPSLRESKINQERFSHAFASCLLMPKGGVGIALKKIRELASTRDRAIGDIELLFLSRIFGVSFEAAARRCEDLGLLPRGGAASLNRELKAQFGSAEKRAEAVDLPPRPTVRFPKIPAHLLNAAVERVREGELSVGKAASILGMSVADLISANAPTTH